MTARGTRNNNPGNLEASPWTRSQPGYVRSDGRFGVFDTMANGIAAQTRLLGNYIRRGYNTIHDLIWRYGNDPGTADDAAVRNYISYVSQRLGVASNAILNQSQAGPLGQAMREFETGQRQSGVINGNGSGPAQGAWGQWGITLPGIGQIGDPGLRPDWWNDQGSMDQIAGDITGGLSALFTAAIGARFVAVFIGIVLIGLAIAAFVLTSDNIGKAIPNVS